jgi:hypothetical protein
MINGRSFYFLFFLGLGGGGRERTYLPGKVCLDGRMRSRCIGHQQALQKIPIWPQEKMAIGVVENISISLRLFYKMTQE